MRKTFAQFVFLTLVAILALTACGPAMEEVGGFQIPVLRKLLTNGTH